MSEPRGETGEPVPAAAGAAAALVIGIGNRLRGDDGAGPLVADRLRAAGLAAVEHSGEGAGLIEAWQGAALVVIVDAMRSGAEPGTIRRFDAAAATLPTGLFHYSSHQFGLAEAIETARLLDRLPPRLIVYGIEGVRFGFGDPLSGAVARAVAELGERIARDIGVPP